MDPTLESILEDFGLSEPELQTYKYLLRSGPASASETARETHQSRGRIYGVLRRLAEIGLARENPTRPVQYAAVPLSTVLPTAIERLKGQQAFLEEAIERAEADTDGDDFGPGQVARPSDVAVFTGRRAVTQELVRVIQGADDELSIVGEGALSERLAAAVSVVQALRDAANRGVNVHLGFPHSSTNRSARRRLADAVGAEVLRDLAEGSYDGMVWVVADHAAFLIAPQPDDAAAAKGDDLGILLDHPALAKAAARQATLAGIEFGADAQREGRTAFPLLERFFDSVSHARKEVVALAPPGWDAVMEEAWEAAVQLYSAARSRGVSFRGVVTPGPEVDRWLDAFEGTWDVRTAAHLPLWVAVVDGREVFVATPAEEPGPPRGARWSEDPDEAQFYAELFERFWQGAQPAEP